MNQALQELTQKTEKTIKAKERKTKRIKEQIKFYSWTILMITAGVCYTISYYELAVFRADYLTATGHATRIIENRRNDQLVAPKEEATNGHEQPVGQEKVTSDTSLEDRTTSMSEIEKKICDTFPEDCDTMIAIAYAENRTLNAAPNPNVNSNGSVDCGLMQVNSIHGYDCDYLENIENNLKVAREIYDREGLGAWSTYKSGKYLSFLQ